MCDAHGAGRSRGNGAPMSEDRDRRIITSGWTTHSCSMAGDRFRRRSTTDADPGEGEPAPIDAPVSIGGCANKASPETVSPTTFSVLLGDQDSSVLPLCDSAPMAAEPEHL